jgi:hypothetical protein
MRMERPETLYAWGEYRYANVTRQKFKTQTRVLLMAIQTTARTAITTTVQIFAGKSYVVAKDCSCNAGIEVRSDAAHYCTIVAGRS